MGMVLRTHDLLRVRPHASLRGEGLTAPPAWVLAALRETPWVVVRRGRDGEGRIPVGVRGRTRSDRFGALLATEAVVEQVPPEAVDLCPAGEAARTPAIAALARVAPLLTSRGRSWGPGGSVAFELVTGARTTTSSSDLDLIVRCDRRVDVREAAKLLDALASAGAPVRVDAILETPSGGVLLTDLVSSPTKVLVRTPDGPRLVADPWSNGGG